MYSRGYRYQFSHSLFAVSNIRYPVHKDEQNTKPVVFLLSDRVIKGKNYLQDSSEILLTWNIAGATEKTWATMLSAHKHPPCYSPHDKNKWHHLISSLSVLPLQAGWRASRERLGKAQMKRVGRQKHIEASPCCSAPSIMHSITVQYWLGFLAGKTLLGINPQRNAMAPEDADEPQGLQGEYPCSLPSPKLKAEPIKSSAEYWICGGAAQY